MDRYPGKNAEASRLQSGARPGEHRQDGAHTRGGRNGYSQDNYLRRYPSPPGFTACEPLVAAD